MAGPRKNLFLNAISSATVGSEATIVLASTHGIPTSGYIVRSPANSAMIGRVVRDVAKAIPKTKSFYTQVN